MSIVLFCWFMAGLAAVMTVVDPGGPNWMLIDAFFLLAPAADAVICRIADNRLNDDLDDLYFDAIRWRG